MTIGIALGSGSARGWAHIGVLQELEKAGIRPEIVVGASIGSLVGAAYASQQLSELEEWVRSLSRIDVWRLLDARFGGGGVMRGNRLMKAVADKLKDKDIESLSHRYAAVAADLHTGKEVWLRKGPMLHAVRASSGLPGLFTPMRHENRWLIDGGVVNPVPVSLCRALGADIVIAVNLNHAIASNRPRTSVSDKEGSDEDNESREGLELIRRWPGIIGSWVSSLREDQQKQEPGMIEVMSTTINIMQDHITRSRLGGDPPDIMITPRLNHLNLMDFHLADEAIERGRSATEALIDDIIYIKNHT